MLCRMEMPANEQIFGRFYRYKFLHSREGGRASLLLMSMVILIFCLVLLFTGDGFTLPLALVLVLVIYIVYVLFLRPISLFRAKAGAAMQTEVIIFTDTGFNRNVTSEESGLSETSSMQYSALHSVVETKKDFYFFTGPSQAHLVDKEYFTKGTPDELRAVLKKVLGQKFQTK